jgi:hypothetical protein
MKGRHAVGGMWDYLQVVPKSQAPSITLGSKTITLPRKAQRGPPSAAARSRARWRSSPSPPSPQRSRGGRHPPA